MLHLPVKSEALSLDGTSVALTEAQAREKAAAQRACLRIDRQTSAHRPTQTVGRLSGDNAGAINGWLAEAEAKNAILSVTAQVALP
eukprot:5725389-Amphidinium_carterae.1